jgi:hypothetical protein
MVLIEAWSRVSADVTGGEPSPVGPAGVVFWLVFCASFTVPAVAGLLAYRRLIARRRRVVSAVRATEHAPSGDPAAAAFVALDASRVDGRVAAAVAVDLGRRGLIKFDLAADGRSRVLVPDLSVGRTHVERFVLGAITGGTAGQWSEPWAGASRRQLVRLRREVPPQVARQGLVANLTTEPLLLLLLGRRPWRWWRLGLVGLAGLVTAVIVDASIDQMVSMGYLAVLLAVLVSLAPWTLTVSGVELRDRWHGHARWLELHGNFGDVPAAGVAIWDEHLVHAVITGVATRAIAELTPPRWRQRSERARPRPRLPLRGLNQPTSVNRHGRHAATGVHRRWLLGLSRAVRRAWPR